MFAGPLIAHRAPRWPALAAWRAGRLGAATLLAASALSQPLSAAEPSAGIAADPAAAAPAEATSELVISAEIGADGALHLAYAPPAGVRRLHFLGPIDSHRVFRAAHLESVDQCAQLSATVMSLRNDPACAVARFKVAPLLLARDRSYEAAQPVGDPMGVMLYTGHYIAAAAGHALRWRWRPPAEGYVLHGGRLSRSELTQKFSAEQVQAALDARPAAPRHAAVSELGGHEYVLLAKAPVVSVAPGALLVHDPAVNEPRVAQAKAVLALSLASLGAAYGVVPAGPVAAVLVASDRPGFHGDVAGRTMRLRVSGAGAIHDAFPAFIAHEVVHWWTSGVFRSDQGKPWLHEGHAEWASLVLLREAGVVDAAASRTRLETAINGCRRSGGKDPYACGMSLMALAQQQKRRPSADRRSALALLASLHDGLHDRLHDRLHDGPDKDMHDGARGARHRAVAADDRQLDARRFAQWADGDAPGPMHRLVADDRAGFVALFDAELLRMKLVDLPRLQVLSSPFPDDLRRSIAAGLMGSLMTEDCAGQVDFKLLTDRVRSGALARCGSLRSGHELVSVAGVPLLADPLGATAAARRACATTQRVQVGDPQSSTVTLLPCPQRWPEPPPERLAVLRADALPLLGLRDD